MIERDNQAGPDARIKKIYKFSIAGLTPQSQGGVFPQVTKTPVRALIGDLSAVGSQNSVTFCNQQLAILGFGQNRPWWMMLRVLQTRVHAPIHPRSSGRCPSFLPQPE